MLEMLGPIPPLAFLPMMVLWFGIGEASFFSQAEDGIRYFHVTGVQTCALPISPAEDRRRTPRHAQREQRDRPPVAGPAVADPGRAHGLHGEAVLHPPADPGPHPHPRGDVG